MSAKRAVPALVVDAACVLVFAAVGRRSHDEGVTVAGVAEVAWPFLLGAALGWVVSLGWRRPYSLVPTGVAVWVATVAVGMLVRKANSAGVAVTFVIVAATATAVLLLGWRLVAALALRRLPDRPR